MINRNDKSNPSGCSANILNAVFVIVFGAAIIVSLFILRPQFERYLESNVCQPETIVEKGNGRGKMKTVICVDKKTGRKTDVSLYQIFGCCPTIAVLVLLTISVIFMRMISSDSSIAKQFDA